jgi:thiol-disulfide isomerase/thioredoxin
MLQKTRFLLVCLVIGLLSGCGQVEFTMSDGRQKSLEEFNGSWLVLNYWAVWCKPCIEEIPELNNLNQYKNISVLGINFDGLVGEELVAEAENLGITYEMILDDPSTDIDIKRPGALPATVLIDKAGKVREVLYGPQTTDSILDKLRFLE